MIRYLVKFIAVTASSVTLHVATILYLPGPIAAEYWVRGAIIVKHDLAARIKEPKIVFLSGSSSLFNVDAARVSEAFHQPVVNFGLHASLRLDRLLGLAPSVMKRGDVLVMPLEQSYFACANNSWTEWDIRNGRTWDADYFDSRPLTQRVGIVFDAASLTMSVEIFYAWLQRIFEPDQVRARLAALAPAADIIADYHSNENRTTTFSHSPNNLDAYGTITNNVGAGFRRGHGVAAMLPGSICPSIKAQLKEFVGGMRAQGVKVIFAYAPYLTDTDPDDTWKSEDKLFRYDLADIGASVVGNRPDVFYPRSFFFNSYLHLNKEGQAIYTTSMIENLKTVIGYP